MRRAALVPCAILAIFVLAMAQPAVAAPASPRVIQFGYTWGTYKILGAEIFTSVGTNLTMEVEVSERNGTRVEEITEFRIGAFSPGNGPFPPPPTNATNPFPHPMIRGIYETIQVIRDPDHCVPSNNSVGFECGVPSATWEHQVVEVQFLRLLEFTDTNGDGGYEPGETIVSELDLADPEVHYEAAYLDGLNATTGSQALPFRNHYPDECCGESWDGWIGQNETQFPYFDGLRFRMSAIGPANVTITGYQWFVAREFQGTNLTPLQAKLDLTVESYPFQQTASRLAFELNFTSLSQGSSTDWEVRPWPEGQAISADAPNTTAVFAWAANASADGSTVSVFGTVVPVDDFSRHVYLSYPKADRIEHDPVFGITDKRLSGGPNVVLPSPFFPSGTLMAFLATLLVASIAIYITERRKR